MRRLEHQLSAQPVRPPKYLRDDYPTSSIMFSVHHIDFNTPADDLNSAAIPRFRRKSPRRRRKGRSSSKAPKRELSVPFDRVEHPAPPLAVRSDEGVTPAGEISRESEATQGANGNDAENETIVSSVTGDSASTSANGPPTPPRRHKTRPVGTERALRKLRPGALTSPKERWVTKTGREFEKRFAARALQIAREKEAQAFLRQSAHRLPSKSDPRLAVRTWLSAIKAIVAMNALAFRSEDRRAAARTQRWLDEELRAAAVTRISAFVRKHVPQARAQYRRESAVAVVVEFLFACQVVPSYDFREAVRRYRYSAVLIQRAVRGLIRTRRARQNLLERAWHRIEGSLEHERACLTPARKDILEKRALVAADKQHSAAHIEPRREERRIVRDKLLSEAIYKHQVERARFDNEERNGRFKPPTLHDARKVVEGAAGWLEFDVKRPPPPMLLLSLTRRGMERAIEREQRSRADALKVHEESITATQCTEAMLETLTMAAADTAALRGEVRGVVVDSHSSYWKTPVGWRTARALDTR